jgi:hypothetical protein
VSEQDWRPCRSYCEHGGVCELSAGHEGLHDSSYCQWSDAGALPKDQADAILASKPGGSEVLALVDALETIGSGR